jgi:hypothetical protein
MLLKTNYCPTSQAGRHGFESRLPLHNPSRICALGPIPALGEFLVTPFDSNHTVAESTASHVTWYSGRSLFVFSCAMSLALWSCQSSSCFGLTVGKRSCRNGLAEAKNGAVVRKHLGYTHIPAPHAVAIEAFYERYFNPYLNFHRPCGVPEEVVNAKGKTKRVYRWYATPWEILRQLPGLSGHLKADVTMDELEL